MFREIGVNEAALIFGCERLGVYCDEENVTGVVTDFSDGYYYVGDENASAKIHPGSMPGLLEALRNLTEEEGPEYFWQTVAEFEEPDEI